MDETPGRKLDAALVRAIWGGVKIKQTRQLIHVSSQKRETQFFP